MDAGVITASAGLIGAAVTLLGSIGAGLAFLIRRADKKREAGEALMLEHLKEQLRKAEKKNLWMQSALDTRWKDGNAWREQLLRHDIEPEPREWTPLPKEELS